MKLWLIAVGLIGLVLTLNAEIVSKNGLATDSATGLVWQDDSEAKTNEKDWDSAKSYCENLTLGGYEDWRLPNIFELTTLLDNTQSEKPYVIDGIKNIVSDLYWSSSTFVYKTYARVVGFSVGSNGGASRKTLNYNVRCVRAEELNFDDLVILKNKGKLKVSQENIDEIANEKNIVKDTPKEEKTFAKESKPISSSITTKIVTKDDITKPPKQEPVAIESKPKVIAPAEPTIKENIQKETTISKKESNQNNSSEIARTNDTVTDKEVKQGEIMVNSGVVREYIKAQTVKFNNACVCITEEDLFKVVRNSFRDDNGNYPKGLLNALDCSHQSVRISTKGHSVEITKYPWGGEFAKITDGEVTVYAEKSDIIIDSEPVNSESESEPMKINESIFSDSATGLVWQDDSEAKTNEKDWDSAKAYCENLTLGGYSDWRLPSYSELLSIVDYSQSNPATISALENVASSSYWSSSLHEYFSSKAWIVDFRSGDTYYDYKSNHFYIRCVRDR